MGAESSKSLHVLGLPLHAEPRNGLEQRVETLEISQGPRLAARCTFENDRQLPYCEMCESPRKASRASGSDLPLTPTELHVSILGLAGAVRINERSVAPAGTPFHGIHVAS